MTDFISKLTAATGIDAGAAEKVVNFLKANPGEVKGLMGDGDGIMDNVQEGLEKAGEYLKTGATAVATAAGGLFEKVKDKFDGDDEPAKDSAVVQGEAKEEGLLEKAKEGLENVGENIKEGVGGLFAKAKDMFDGDEEKKAT